MLSDKIYDRLKLAQLIIPAIATLWYAISSVWQLPYVEPILATMSAVSAFIATLLKISSYGYEGDGEMIIDASSPDKDIYRMVVDSVDALKDKKTVTFKVSHHQEPDEYFTSNTLL